MLLPRPEIRIPTRFGSRIVDRGPVLRGAPRAGLTAHGAAALARFDAADFEYRLARAFERGRHFGGKLRSNDDGHSDAAVKSARHLLRSDASGFLQERKDRRQLPPFRIYDGVTAVR